MSVITAKALPGALDIDPDEQFYNLTETQASKHKVEPVHE